MGMWISAFQQGTTWRGENAQVQWSMYNGAGFTTFTVADALYRYSTDWPGFMGLQYSGDGAHFSNATGFPEATPAGSKSWTAGAAHSSVALGATYRYLRFIALGSIASNISNDVGRDRDHERTLVRDSAKIPQLAYTSSSIGAYHLQCTITNNGTGDNFAIDFVMQLNETLQVDCLNKNVTYSANGSNAIGVLTPNAKRNYWITIEPIAANNGVTNGNVFQFDDTGTAGGDYYHQLVR